jgi:hypothetical protein
VQTQTPVQFQIQISYLPRTSPNSTCKETSNSPMQVVSSKIIFLKVFSGKNFGEFWGVFLNGLMPLKIQTNFQNWFSPEFLIQNPFRF